MAQKIRSSTTMPATYEKKAKKLRIFNKNENEEDEKTSWPLGLIFMGALALIWILGKIGHIF